MSVYWVKIINLSEIAAETHQFYNSEILKRWFSEFSFTKPSVVRSKFFKPTI